ncbi:MAG: hypothetical protein ABIA93_07630 [Candidatus Woesearchaeota archaeon]
MSTRRRSHKGRNTIIGITLVAGVVGGYLAGPIGRSVVQSDAYHSVSEGTAAVAERAGKAWASTTGALSSAYNSVANGSFVQIGTVPVFILGDTMSHRNLNDNALAHSEERGGTFERILALYGSDVVDSNLYGSEMQKTSFTGAQPNSLPAFFSWLPNSTPSDTLGTASALASPIDSTLVDTLGVGSRISVVLDSTLASAADSTATVAPKKDLVYGTDFVLGSRGMLITRDYLASINAPSTVAPTAQPSKPYLVFDEKGEGALSVVGKSYADAQWIYETPTGKVFAGNDTKIDWTKDTHFGTKVWNVEDLVQLGQLPDLDHGADINLVLDGTPYSRFSNQVLVVSLEDHARGWRGDAMRFHPKPSSNPYIISPNVDTDMSNMLPASFVYAKPTN